MKYLWIIAILLCSHAYSDDVDQSKPLKGYVLSENETKLIDFMLKDDAAAFSSGGESLMGEELVPAPVSEVAKLYDENQVAGDQKYFHKTLYVSGTINSINSGMGNQPNLSMVGPGMISRPTVMFAKPNIERIAKLKKGQKLWLVCNGAGVIMGSPVFDDCVFADEYAQAKSSKITEEMNRFLSGSHQYDINQAMLALFIIATTKTLPANSSCFKDGKRCIREIRDIKKDKQFEAMLADSLNELKLAGIEVKQVVERIRDSGNKKKQ